MLSTDVSRNLGLSEAKVWDTISISGLFHVGLVFSGYQPAEIQTTFSLRIRIENCFAFLINVALFNLPAFTCGDTHEQCVNSLFDSIQSGNFRNTITDSRGSTQRNCQQRVSI